MMRSVAAGVLSGGLLVLSLPKPDIHVLAWVAFVPLLVFLTATLNLRTAVAAAYATGVVFFAGTCYWITETMIIYGGLGASAVGVGVLFAAVYALYFVVFAVGLRFFIQRFGPSGLFLAAPLWVTVELLRAHLFSGFPWMLTGYALVPYAGLLQVVSWTGIYGLSFIATAINSMLAFAFIRRSRMAFGAAGAAILISVALPIIGETPSNQSLAVRLVQTNISLDQPWEQPASAGLMDELEELSASPTPRRSLIVWPETPAPFFLKEDAEFRARMQRIATKTGSHLILGYIDSVEGHPSNSAALMAPSGDVVSRYDKIHLVPFGEYIPLKSLLFFAESLTRQVGDFIPGKELTISTIDGGRLSTAICYESIFPNLVRQFVAKGSELIVVITNDGWFGESSAPFQHLRMGVVRAVENRRYIVRAANTGVSAIIDPYGRIEKETPIGKRMLLDGTAKFRSDLTFYTRFGDLFAYLNVLVVSICLLWRMNARRTV
jgi:apolipoprotein N-acyltransferase